MAVIEKLHPKAGVEEGPSQREILADKKQSGLFGLFLEEAGDTDLAGKVFRKEALEAAELEQLEVHKTGFLERMGGIKKIEDGLTPELLADVAGVSDEFKTILGSVGSEKLKEVFSNHIESLLIGQPHRLADILSHMEDIAKRQATLEHAERQIQEVLKKYAIPEDVVVEILKKGKQERENALFGLLDEAERTPWFKTQGKWIERIHRMEESALQLNRADEIEKALKALQSPMEGLGWTLSDAFMQEGSDLKKSLMDVLYGEPMEKESIAGMKEVQRVMTSGDDMKKKWEDEKSKTADWDKLSDSEKTAKADAFRENLARPIKDKKGLWMKMYEAFMKGVDIAL